MLHTPTTLLPALALTLALALSALTAAGCGHDREPVGALPSADQGQAGGTGLSPHGQGGAQTRPGVTDDVNFITAAGIEIALTDRWRQIGERTQFRLATFRCNGPGGEAELVFSYLGRQSGGNPQANMDRWIGQLLEPRDVKKAQVQQGGLMISLVQARGGFAQPSMSADMPELGPYADAILFGLVIEGGPEGTLFLKLIGPAETVATLGDELELLVRSIRPVR